MIRPVNASLFWALLIESGIATLALFSTALLSLDHPCPTSIMHLFFYLYLAFLAPICIVNLSLGDMHGLKLAPWMTRREAAEYLHWRVDELDAHLVPLGGHPALVRGKMRYLLMEIEGALRVRILAADVFSILPLPPQPVLSAGRDGYMLT